MTIAIWIICMILCGYIAREKNRSVEGWVIASFFFGLIPLIILIFLPTNYE